MLQRIEREQPRARVGFPSPQKSALTERFTVHRGHLRLPHTLIAYLKVNLSFPPSERGEGACAYVHAHSSLLLQQNAFISRATGDDTSVLLVARSDVATADQSGHTHARTYTVSKRGRVTFVHLHESTGLLFSHLSACIQHLCPVCALFLFHTLPPAVSLQMLLDYWIDR